MVMPEEMDVELRKHRAATLKRTNEISNNVAKEFIKLINKKPKSGESIIRKR